MDNEDRKALIVAFINDEGGVYSETCGTLDDVVQFLREPTHDGGPARALCGTVTIRAVAIG